MENTTVPVSSLIAMIVTFLLMFGGPFVAAIFGARKMKKSWLALLAGFLSFFVMQLLIRIPMLNWLSTKEWFVSFAQGNKWLYMALLAITASLFEESGRLLTARFIVGRKCYTPGNAIWHGVGHGGIESIYLSLKYINYIVYAFLINSGNTAGAAASLAPGQFDQIAVLLTNSPSWTFLIAGIERIMTLCVQIGLSVLAFEALRKRSVKIGLLMFLIHAVVDFAVVGVAEVMGHSALGMLLCEGIVLLFAVASIIMIVKLIRNWNAEGEPAIAPLAM